MPTLGERDRSLRTQADLTLAEVEDGADLSVPYVADIEHDRRVPSLDALRRIASVFDQDTLTLLTDVSPNDASS